MKADWRSFALLMLAALLTACERKAPSAGGVAAARQLPAMQGIGYVEPLTEVRRLAFKSEGIIGECQVEISQRVKRGDLLVTLRSEQEAAELAAAESDERLARAEQAQVLAGINPFLIRTAESELAFAQTEVAYAQRELERQQQLSKARVASTTEHDRAETDLQRKQAAVRRAEAALDNLRNHVRNEDRALTEAKVQSASARVAAARRRLEETMLRAPMDGTVLEVLRREGESVSGMAPEPVVIFGDLSRLRVRAEIDESYASAPQVGQRATVSGPSLGGRVTSGSVVLVKPVMGKKTVFARSATERKDLDVIQVLVEMPVGFHAPVGLEVDVGIENKTVARGNIH